MSSKKPIHFTQYYGIDAAEDEIDFFDTNLKHDSPIFLDPTLLKNSPIERERQLYSRYDKYFSLVLNKIKLIKSGLARKKDLIDFLTFPEPREVCLGYTEESSDGSGLAGKFAISMSDFFMRGIGLRLLEEKRVYAHGLVNPESFLVFVEDIAQDGISDLSVNLLMDYLCDYTAEICNKYGIPRKSLMVKQSFDFDDEMWTGGRPFNLPENPYRKDLGVVLVPKRLLRKGEDIKQSLKSKAVRILRTDLNLKKRFGGLVSRSIKDINLQELQSMLQMDTKTLDQFVEAFEKQKNQSYNFIADPLQILAYKKFFSLNDTMSFPTQPTDSSGLIRMVKEFLKSLREYEELKGGWRDYWAVDKNGTTRPVDERSWGRRFRGYGEMYFHRYPAILFDPEVETGQGPVDFRIVYGDCCVVIELKNLSNASSKGDPKIKSYIHGLTIQLPEYAKRLKANYVLYITAQHYKKHSPRVNELKELVSHTSKELKRSLPSLIELEYQNFDLSRKASISKL